MPSGISVGECDVFAEIQSSVLSPQLKRYSITHVCQGHVAGRNLDAGDQPVSICLISYFNHGCQLRLCLLELPFLILPLPHNVSTGHFTYGNLLSFVQTFVGIKYSKTSMCVCAFHHYV